MATLNSASHSGRSYRLCHRFAFCAIFTAADASTLRTTPMAASPHPHCSFTCSIRRVTARSISPTAPPAAWNTYASSMEKKFMTYFRNSFMSSVRSAGLRGRLASVGASHAIQSGCSRMRGKLSSRLISSTFRSFMTSCFTCQSAVGSRRNTTRSCSGRASTLPNVSTEVGLSDGLAMASTRISISASDTGPSSLDTGGATGRPAAPPPAGATANPRST